LASRDTLQAAAGAEAATPSDDVMMWQHCQQQHSAQIVATLQAQ